MGVNHGVERSRQVIGVPAPTPLSEMGRLHGGTFGGSALTPISGAEAAPSSPSFPALATIRVLQAARTGAAPTSVPPPRACLPVGGGKSGCSGEHRG
jgi:hypothetical protein